LQVKGKGGKDTEFGVKAIAAWLNQEGLSNATLQCDKEPAILDVCKRIQQKAPGTMLREAKLEDKEGNGGVGRWHRSLQNQIRAIKLNFEARSQPSRSHHSTHCSPGLSGMQPGRLQGMQRQLMMG
jgi:hypothetical protein